MSNSCKIYNDFIVADNAMCEIVWLKDEFGDLTNDIHLATEGQAKHPNDYFITFDLLD
jgi:hypothetical protein